ncbi:MAG: hypothetical protein J3K34DRAFT_422852 [Monoraphidium minutum]|nr:MAG: hypothetical protein J3K34DRAFT_422852 [Monoraphidium minutum]
MYNAGGGAWAAAAAISSCTQGAAGGTGPPPPRARARGRGGAQERAARRGQRPRADGVGVCANRVFYVRVRATSTRGTDVRGWSMVVGEGGVRAGCAADSLGAMVRGGRKRKAKRAQSRARVPRRVCTADTGSARGARAAGSLSAACPPPGGGGLPREVRSEVRVEGRERGKEGGDSIIEPLASNQPTHRPAG